MLSSMKNAFGIQEIRITKRYYGVEEFAYQTNEELKLQLHFSFKITPYDEPI